MFSHQTSILSLGLLRNKKRIKVISFQIRLDSKVISCAGSILENRLFSPFRNLSLQLFCLTVAKGHLIMPVELPQYLVLGPQKALNKVCM